MSSREEILSAVKKNKPEASALPELKEFARPDLDVLACFKTLLEKMGGNYREVADLAEVKTQIALLFPDAKVLCSTVEEIPGNIDLRGVTDPHQLEPVDLAIVKGAFGVAENAAIWVDDSQLAHRAVPFICQHLVLIIPKNSLVYNMHQAYKKINIRANSYGVFIAGPSKTADIEQSLVVGAHGPRSLMVFLTEN